jgi:hypothetical protein
MRTLDLTETEKIESWLDRVELFLMELQATERAQLILDLNQQILALAIASSDQRIEDILRKMGEPLQVANRLRSEKGLRPRQKISRPTSLSKVLIFSILASLVFMTTCTFSLPFLIPWGISHLSTHFAEHFSPSENGSHSFRFFKNFSTSSQTDGQEPDTEESETTEQNMALPADPLSDAANSPTNDQDGGTSQSPQAGITQENIKGSFKTEAMSSIRIQARNAKFTISKSKNLSIQYDCQIANLAFARPFIRKSPSGAVTLALDQVTESATCDIKVPDAVALEIQIDSGDLKLKQLSQNIQVTARSASLSFSAGDAAAYEIEASTQKGEVKGLADFEKKQKSLKSSKKYKAVFNLQEGNINFCFIVPSKFVT